VGHPIRGGWGTSFQQPERPVA